MPRLVAGGLESAFEQAFVNIVHSTWFGRYAREDSNFFRALHGNSPSNDELFFYRLRCSFFSRGWCRVPVPFFSRIRRVIEPAFQQASKNIAVKMSSGFGAGKIRKIQRGR